MMNPTIARRYAQALYQEAQQQSRVEQVDADVALIRETLDGSRELVRLFESPIVAREKKEAVVRSLFAARVDQLTMEFLAMLIEKKREGLFPAVVRAYHALRDAQQGIVEAKARVASPLGEAEEKQLIGALERLSGKQVRLAVEHDPALVGGLVVRVGDTVYDGSVRHQLRSLRAQLTKGRLAPINGQQN